MKMKGSKDVLSSVIKTAQMGQIGIRSVLNMPLRASLKDALRSQLREYDKIEKEGLALATERGWELKQQNPAVQHMTNMMTRTRLSFGDVSSKAAAMMIQGNTRGLIKGLKTAHHIKNGDMRVLSLSQKLLECEKANIQQMQGYV
jgi:hypothetical protein